MPDVVEPVPDLRPLRNNSGGSTKAAFPSARLHRTRIGAPRLGWSPLIWFWVGLLACDSTPPIPVLEVVTRTLIPAPVVPTNPSGGVPWPHYGGDPGGSRYSSLTDIDRNSVDRLVLAWTWAPSEATRLDSAGGASSPGRFQATPLMLHDTLYLSTSFGRAVALHAETGETVWDYDSGAWRWPLVSNRDGFVNRGVGLWSGDGTRRVFLASRWRLIALDAASGRRDSAFGAGGEVDLSLGLRWPANRLHINTTSPPLVIGDLVVVGSAIADNVIYERDPPGAVQAFDARTGERRWVWSPIPERGEPGWETWRDGSAERTGHGNVWAPLSADTVRGLLYLPVSAPSNDWYGGARVGDNLYTQSLVCLDARTGRRVWHFQIVHHGLWDYDPAAPPTLVSVERDGERLDAVALAGKTGFLYVFDRVTGEPVWPIEERPVPASDVPGEAAAATQPVPLKPPPFARQGFGEADLVDFTPELRDRALRVFRRYRSGPLFTPPSLEGTLVLPGWYGGAGWGATSYDPATRTLFIKASNHPVLGQLREPDPSASDRQGRFVQAHDFADDPLYVSFPKRSGILGWLGGSSAIPLIRPPYGTLTAIDLDRGEFRWQVTLGDAPWVRSHPKLRDLDLPPLGVAGPPGGTVTAGGLIFLTGGGTVLYAIDTEDGRVRWQYDLGRTGWSNPMTYRTGRGTQFVVVAAGRGTDARLMAFTLSRP